MGDLFSPELLGHLWHTTNLERYKCIAACGFILAEPDIPDIERFHTGVGPARYPYVRSIGGVSLFDFVDFCPTSYGKKYRFSRWQGFAPYRKAWRNSVWIEIDREAIKANFLSGDEVFLRRRRENAHCRNFMPIIEAASLAPIPVSAFRQVLIRGEDFPNFQVLTGTPAVDNWHS